ncbi:MAG: amino acid ABC transporter substrate-binding protein [Deltaproteobacteria bacterium]|nr:MAG: amino acid ABC transporter substrate-binding protein [Deltaproteobacteria bacterium]
MKPVLIVMSCLVSICVAGAAFAGDGSWKRVQDAGELVIGLDDAFPPMGYRVADGTLVGFDIDAAEAVGKRLGIRIKWQPTAWDGVIHSLYAKKFDCIWNGMTITPERAEKVNFTRPYIMDGQVAVVRFNDNRFKSYDALGGAVIGVQKGSSAINAVKKLPGTPAKVREYNDNPKALLDLEAGRLDAVIIDNVVGRDTISKRPGKYKTLPGFISKEPFGVAFRKTDITLRDKIQKTLDEMVKDGSLAAISKKWFAEDIVDPSQW